MARKVRIPTAFDPDEIFTDSVVRELVGEAASKLPLDIGKLRAGLIDAAKNFASERSNDGNEIHRQIATLCSAAQNRRFNAAAKALTELSSAAREYLNTRYSDKLPSLPQPAALRDPAEREKACIAVIDRCEIGGRWVDGRKRPFGRRSRTWEPVLWAPKMNPHPEIRSAERTFVMWLQVAWAEAAETRVPVTAHRENPGPFARFAQAALQRMDVRHADAVELINDLKRQANDVELIDVPFSSHEIELIAAPVRPQNMKDE